MLAEGRWLLPFGILISGLLAWGTQPGVGTALDPVGDGVGMGHPPSPAHPKILRRDFTARTRPQGAALALAAGIVPFSAGLVGRLGCVRASSLLSAGEELIILFSHYPGLKNPFLSSINLGA